MLRTKRVTHPVSCCLLLVAALSAIFGASMALLFAHDVRHGPVIPASRTTAAPRHISRAASSIPRPSKQPNLSNTSSDQAPPLTTGAVLRYTIPPPHAYPSHVSHPSFPRGVAVNVVPDTPHAPANLVGLLSNFAVNLPPGWPIQLFVTSRSLKRLSETPGVARLVAQGRVVLTPVPFDLDDKGLGRRELLLSPWVWKAVLADSVLVFDGTSALCGNTPSSIEEDFAGRYDWVGAAWKWAKPGSAHEWGGNGALSLRNRTLVLKVLEAHILSTQLTATSSSTTTTTTSSSSFSSSSSSSSSSFSSFSSSPTTAQPQQPQKQKHQQHEHQSSPQQPPVESRFAVFKGNEDMWFVKKLVEMRDEREKYDEEERRRRGGGGGEGDGENEAVAGVNYVVETEAKKNVNASQRHDREAAVAEKATRLSQTPLHRHPQHSPPPEVRLASRAVSMAWATEELFDEKGPVPIGVYHTMRSLPDALRAKVLRACPEAKRLFEAKHERGK